MGNPGALSRGVFAGVLLAASAALAIPSNNPAGTYGKLTLLAVTATPIPASPLVGRYAVAVQNLDAAAIYCGWDASVTAFNGWKVDPATSFSVDISYDANLGRATLYCFSTAGTAADAIRWMEVR